MLDEMLRRQYSECNYRIDRISDKNKCMIFCSSNGLWQPHNEETFVKSFHDKDRYEWENIAKAEQIRQHFGKIIYIRDIYKHFYVEGINDRIDTIDKIIEFLRPEISGYELTVAGNSSGGYLACILGVRLNAARVFSFGGQFDLRTWGGANGTYTFKQYDFLTKHLLNEQREKYFDVRDLLGQTHMPVFHFYAAYNEPDRRQADHVKAYANLYLFKLDEKQHGNYIWSINMPYVFCADNDVLIRLNGKFKNKTIKKWVFSISTVGIRKTVCWLVSKTARRFGLTKG